MAGLGPRIASRLGHSTHPACSLTGEPAGRRSAGTDQPPCGPARQSGLAWTWIWIWIWCPGRPFPSCAGSISAQRSPFAAAVRKFVRNPAHSRRGHKWGRCSEPSFCHSKYCRCTGFWPEPNCLHWLQPQQRRSRSARRPSRSDKPASANFGTSILEPCLMICPQMSVLI